MVGSGCDQLVVGYADLVVVLTIWLLFRWLGVVVTNWWLVMLRAASGLGIPIFYRYTDFSKNRGLKRGVFTP